MKTQVYSLFLIMLLNFSLKGISQTDANIPSKYIAIYIDYPDAPASVTSTQLNNILNGVNYTEPGIKKSFRDYWYDQSRRNLVINHDIFFYNAPNPVTYYKTLGDRQSTLLWKDALEWVIKNNPTYDWNLLTRTLNGGITVMIIGSTWGPQGFAQAHFPAWTLSNGVVVERLAANLLKTKGEINNNLNMTYHECAHSIFSFPDTYDSDSSSRGTGPYTLMSNSFKNDAEPVGGPFRVQKNWGRIIEPEPGTHTITLEADGDDIVALRNPHDPLEFFTIEARKKSNKGNSAFTAELGLLIWHSDEKTRNSANRNEDMTPMKHYTHSIEQADGLFGLENKKVGDIGDIYVPGNSFTNTTTPNTKWWDNSDSNISVSNIEFDGDSKIRFTVTIPNLHIDHYDEIPQSNWKVISAPVSLPGYEAEKSFDGDAKTYYHIPQNNALPRPHDIILDLGKEYTMNEFFYSSINKSAPIDGGQVGDYKIYISKDSFNWGTEVASGTFFDSNVKQYVLFAKTTGRYLKFSAINSSSIKDVKTSIAEINIRGFEPNTLSVSNNFLNTDFLIHPNPTTGDFTLELPGGEAIITVINNLGQQIIKTQTTDKTTDLRLYNSGVYHVNLTTSKGTYSQKLIVK